MLDEYRSLVGNILFYVVKIGPDCGNASRDLERHMSNPGEEHWKSMGQIVGYLKGKELHRHVMCNPESLTAVKHCDASYASDPIAIKSVSGMIGTLGGMMTNWSSRTIKTTALSSTESEYIAIGECGQELKFMCMLPQ